MNTDITSLVPEVLDRQDRAYLVPVESAEDIAYQGYAFRLEPQIEFQRLDKS